VSNGNVIQFPSGAGAGAGGSPPGTPGTPPASGGGAGGSGGAVTDPYLWSRQQVWAIRYTKKYNEDQKRRIIHNFICNTENKKTTQGAFLKTKDKRAYLFDGDRCKLYRIDISDAEFCGYLWQVYGLNSSEQTTRHVINSLRIGTIANGLPRDIRRFSYYDRDAQKLYVSSYDGTCFEIDGGQVINRVANGHGAAVFLDDDGGTPCPGINPNAEGDEQRGSATTTSYSRTWWTISSTSRPPWAACRPRHRRPASGSGSLSWRFQTSCPPSRSCSWMASAGRARR
jgi:hypothetical protein